MGLKGTTLSTGDELSKLLAQKAEKRDVDRLVDSKANKAETENMQDTIATLNNQLSHLIMVFNESLKLNLAKGQETTQARENRTKQLMSQLHALGQWTCKSG